MTETRQRPSFAVILPPPIWGLIFLLIGWALGWKLELPPAFNAPIIGWLLMGTGAFIATWGRVTFDKAGAEIVPVSKVNSVLVTHGPFTFTRNPMYLGILTFMAGLAVWFGTVTELAAVVAFFLFVNFISIPYEEVKMERQYGDQFRAYMTRVRRWI